MTTHAINMKLCIIGPHLLVEKLCASCYTRWRYNKRCRKSELKWDGMSQQHFYDQLETTPALLSYWDVLTADKDQDHRKRAWMTEFCYLIIWELMQ